MDDVNIHIDELILDGASPPSPEQLHAALSRQADEEHGQEMAVAARAIAEHLRTQLDSNPLTVKARSTRA